MIWCNNTLITLFQLLDEILARSENQFTIFLSYKQSLNSIYKDRYFVFIFIHGYSSLSDNILFSALKSPFLSCKDTRRYNGYSTIYLHISNGTRTQKNLSLHLSNICSQSTNWRNKNVTLDSFIGLHSSRDLGYDNSCLISCLGKFCFLWGQNPRLRDWKENKNRLRCQHVSMYLTIFLHSRMRYIEEQLSKRKGKQEAEKEGKGDESKYCSPEEAALQAVPTHLRASSKQQSEEMLSNQMLSGIPEVDLGIEWVLLFYLNHENLYILVRTSEYRVI